MTTFEQPRLFDVPQVSEPAPGSESSLIEWSYSRRELFERCPLWYYFNYYGAKSGAAKNEPHKQELRFLKSLSNRHLRAGDILHLVIRTYLKQLKEGEAWAVERLVRWAREIYRRDLERSISYQRGNVSFHTDDRSVLLSEFYFGLPNARALWEESAQRLEKALRNFARLADLERFKRGASHPDSLIEETVYISEPNFKLKGKIDYAYPEEKRVVIVDWKLGEANGGEDSLQLLSYALLTMKRFGCGPGVLDLSKVYLQDGTVVPCSIGDEDVRRATARIIQDSERMKAVDHYGRNGIARAFTPCAQRRICAMCPFQGFCPKEYRSHD